MSLSWLDNLTLLLHPHRVVLERRSWRGGTLRHDAMVPPPTTADEPPWQPALQAAFALLDAHSGRGATLRVLVSDHLVRYALLPWSDHLCSPKGRRDMANALFKSTLGERADTLEIAIDQAAYGLDGIAAGIDSGLLTALRIGAKARRQRLASVQPRLIAELAARHKEISDGWFAGIDRDWLTLAGLNNGCLVSLHNHRLGTADPERLAGELDGLLAAGRATVASRRLLIAHGDIPPPRQLADWETTCRPYRVAGMAHA